MVAEQSPIENEVVVDGAKLKWYDVPANHVDGRAPSTLVLLPGLTGSAAAFAVALSGLSARGIRLCALEWRGHGGSEPGRQRPTVELCAADLRDFVRHLGETRVCVLGSSMGVGVLWRYLERFGDERVDRCIWCDQPPQISADAPGLEEKGYRREWAVVSRRQNRFLAWVLSFKSWLAPVFIGFPRLLQRMPVLFQRIIGSCAQLHMLNSDGWALGWLMIDTAREDHTDRLSLTKRPTLIIGGEASFVPSDIARWVAARVSCPRQLIVYPKPWGTHTPFYPDLACPEAAAGKQRFVDDVTEFLLCPEERLHSETTEAFPGTSNM